MTMLTKANLMFKKSVESPNTVSNEEGMEIDVSKPFWKQIDRNALVTVTCMTLMGLLVTVSGVICGMIFYRHVMSVVAMHRYQGYCNIPIASRPLDPALIEPNLRLMPLHWYSTPNTQTSYMDDPATDDLLNLLREELQIGDTVEKISVFENGKKVNFIHDFATNLTGIVDTDRCYMMELDPSLVMSPDLFVLSIERGDEFDVSSVRHSLRAALPAVAAGSSGDVHRLMEECADKPIYRLEKENPVVRKRSLDAPPHDYIQFSGNHVQEIEISNLAQLLEEEQRAKNKSAGA